MESNRGSLAVLVDYAFNTYTPRFHPRTSLQVTPAVCCAAARIRFEVRQGGRRRAAASLATRLDARLLVRAFRRHVHHVGSLRLCRAVPVLLSDASNSWPLFGAARIHPNQRSSLNAVTRIALTHSRDGVRMPIFHDAAAARRSARTSGVDYSSTSPADSPAARSRTTPSTSSRRARQPPRMLNGSLVTTVCHLATRPGGHAATRLISGKRAAW